MRKPIIIFVHGFKGFKDWGHFHLISEYFANQGFIFLKLNLSHNGTTADQPGEFADLEAFGNNNYLHELNDLDELVNHINDPDFEIDDQEINRNIIYLIGHSRGGGISIVKTFEDERIKGIATWTAVNTLAPQLNMSGLQEWHDKGVLYIMNSRTNQQMPMYYQFYETYLQYQNRLSIEHAVRHMGRPFIAFHGSADETLPPGNLDNFKQWNHNIEIHLIESANHTFGGIHPYQSLELPQATRVICEKTNVFFQSI